MSSSEFRKLITLLESVAVELDEGLLDTIIGATRKVFSYVSNIFNRIGFGQRAEINLGEWLDTEKVDEAGKSEPDEKTNSDLTSMIGYYNEFSVAARLAEILEKSGVNIKSDLDVTLEKYANNYRKRILANQNNFTKKTPDQVQAELTRVDEGSKIMAEKLYSEISEANDLKLIDVGIVLTGESSKGAEKEDVRITIYKKNKKTVIDVIKASLKIYKGKSINMANLTFPSYLSNIIVGQNLGRGDAAVDAFLQQYPQYNREMMKVVNIYKKWPELKRAKSREEANEFMTANKGYQKMRNVLFTKIFADFYEKDRAAMNERILRHLGLDGADEVYMLIGDRKDNMIAISSRTSPEFAELYGRLKADFVVTFTNPAAASCQMLFHSSDGELIMSFNLAFKEGATIPHFWDIGKIVQGERERNREKPAA